MALYYNLVFILLAVEMVFFGVLSLPYPRKIRRTVLSAVSAPFRNEQFQIAIKCVLGFVLVLFIDSVNRVYAVTSELHASTGVSQVVVQLLSTTVLKFKQEDFMLKETCTFVDLLCF